MIILSLALLTFPATRPDIFIEVVCNQESTIMANVVFHLILFVSSSLNLSKGLHNGKQEPIGLPINFVLT